MKDGFLRGDQKELARKSSMRHLRSRIRASLFFNEGDGRVQGMPASEDDLARATQGGVGQYHDTPQHGEESGRTRSRSFSETLGDFFNPKRSKQRKDGAGTDIEQGDDPGDQAGPSR